MEFNAGQGLRTSPGPGGDHVVKSAEHTAADTTRERMLENLMAREE